MTRGFDWDKARNKDRARDTKHEKLEAPAVLHAKFASTCPICKQRIAKGEQVYYRKGAGVWHILCPPHHHHA